MYIHVCMRACMYVCVYIYIYVYRERERELERAREREREYIYINIHTHLYTEIERVNLTLLHCRLLCEVQVWMCHQQRPPYIAEGLEFLITAEKARS